MMDRPYLFILNPTSGTSLRRNSELVQKTIHAAAAQYQQKAVIIFTEQRGHATALVRENLRTENWKAIVAVGGDGTINEIGSPLVGTDIPVGILALGSGNGLARHLGLPLRLDAGLKKIFTGEPVTIDTATINDIPFFCTAGMGFDAFVGYRFSKQGTRGLSTYMKVSFESYWTYKPQQYFLNGQETKAFSLSFANAGQFGNNAWIAPHADLQDGQLDVCRIKPFPKWYGTSLAYQLFTRQMKPSAYIAYQRMEQAEVETKSPPLIHYDGEPMQLQSKKIIVKIRPKSLRVIV